MVNTKYTYWKPVSNIIFDGNSNVFPICDHFKDICSQNVQDRNLDLLEWAKYKSKYANQSYYVIL